MNCLLISLLLSIAPPATAPSATAPSNAAFPATWTGHWKGPCKFIPAAGSQTPAQDFIMELRIAPTDDPKRFTWEIVYDMNGKRQVRPYEIVAVDEAAGHYVIDEKSSIKIDSYLIDDVLYAQFRVQSALVTASYRIEGDLMIVELVTNDPTQPIDSGGENGVPAVKSYPMRGVQKGLLNKG